MRLILSLLLIPTLGFGQIIIGPLTLGEYYNEVVFEGVYYSPGNCTWADGTDFMFDFNGLTEIDGMEYVLIIDEPDPDSTFLMNGWQPVYVGDSTVFTPTTTGLGISAASNPAELHFHIRLVGTPTLAGQPHPCWIDQGQTLALCDNVWGLFNGETPIACTVQSSTGIDEFDRPISIELINERLMINSSDPGVISVHTVEGKLIHESKINVGSTSIDRPNYTGLTIIQVQTENTRFTKKILLHK